LAKFNKTRVRNKLYISACVLGIIVCALKIFPADVYMSTKIDSAALIILLCGICLYLAGYCLYRAAMVISQYYTYSDLR